MTFCCHIGEFGLNDLKHDCNITGTHLSTFLFSNLIFRSLADSIHVNHIERLHLILYSGGRRRHESTDWQLYIPIELEVVKSSLVTVQYGLLSTNMQNTASDKHR
jgi:hypothetical protein